MTDAFGDLNDALGDTDESDERDSLTRESDESVRPESQTDTSEQTNEFDRSDLPLILRRQTVKDERSHVDLFALEDTEDGENDAVHELGKELDDNLSLIDAREAIFRAGLQNLDDALEELRAWGYE